MCAYPKVIGIIPWHEGGDGNQFMLFWQVAFVGPISW
jgi:hypothetical protein